MKNISIVPFLLLIALWSCYSAVATLKPGMRFKGAIFPALIIFFSGHSKKNLFGKRLDP